jgi:hypothetical protein
MSDCPTLIRNNLRWYEAMVNTYNYHLSETEKKDLAEWEIEHVDSETAAIPDWPGWQRIIGLPPWKLSCNGVFPVERPHA